MHMIGSYYEGRGEEGMVESCSLFVDDILPFCKDFEDKMAHLHWQFMWSEEISRLNRFWKKCKLILIFV